jgi:hypothetical protein
MMFTITPVIEIPGNDGKPWPWPVAAGNPYTFEPLIASSLESMGIFMAALFRYYGEDRECSVDQLLDSLRNLEDPLVVAPGGFQATDGDMVVIPGCCCGLEGWTEWREFLVNGTPPWLGNDPWPRVEFVNGSVHLWRDAPDKAPRESLRSISVSREKFEAALALAETQLCNFFTAIPRWFESVQRADETDVIGTIRESFLNPNAASHG